MSLKKFLFNILIIPVILAGCVSMPKQTATLTVLLGNQIAESKRSHLVLIDEWGILRRKNAEQYLEYVWIPKTILKFMKSSDKPYKNLKAVMKSNCKLDKADEIKELTQAISGKIEKQRRKMLEAINAQVQSLRSQILTHYADIERMHGAILANIRSVVKGGQFEKDIRDAMARPLKKIAPIKKADEAINKLMED